MKKSLLICSLLFLSNGTQAQPHIQAPTDTVYDFDLLYQGEVKEVSFEVKNVGRDTLVIDKVESTCGCTAALASDNRVPPNGSTKILAVFDSKGILGPVRKYVTVFSNDQRRPELTFEISGNVGVEIDADPPELLFADAVVGKPIRSTITLTNIVSKPISLERLENPYESLKIDFARTTLKSSEELTLHATMIPKEPGQLAGFVRLYTDSDRQRIVEIKIYANTRWADAMESSK
jgi:hypothetical protein